jgi:hypothetical protein
MKFRAICFGLVALVSMTSGCLYMRHPCWGFRFHPCQTGGMCAPACSSPIHRPLLHHHKFSHGAIGCPTCAGGPSGAFPAMAYPPIIGNPMQLPAPKVVPSGDMPNPMPTKPAGF